MSLNNKDNQPNTFFFSRKALQEWVSAGLISNELLSQDKIIDLIQYIYENKEHLDKHSYAQKKEEDFPCEVKLPSDGKWAETYELHVTDKKTGKVVSTLDLMAELKLLDDIYLRVKAIELPLWKKETANIKNLTTKQSEDLKKFIVETGSKRSLTREEIKTAIREIQKEKNNPPKYRQSGHLIDQKLKYTKPGAAGIAIELDEKTKRKIADSQLEVKAEGIRLTEPESKIEHALTKILRDNSQNKNPNDDDYYFGNEKRSIVEYGGRERRTPVVRFKRSDLYKAYLCKNIYSGADAEYIDNLLIQYAAKKCLIKYDYVKKISKGTKTETLTDRVEEFQPLIKLLYFFPNLTNEEKKRLDKGSAELRDEREEVIVAFNPIFIDQIDTKFVEFPDDTNRRLMIAAGDHKKVTVAMRRLMEWCLRELSAKRYKSEINEENLSSMLALEKYVKQNRNKLLHECIKKAIETVKAMGIILKSDRVQNSKGGAKWIFTLNSSYE
jgi:hypothetical protein